MKATKMRNKQFYRASLTTLSNQTGSHLSKELQKKYGKRTIRLTKGDGVKIVRGEYKGVDGKVTKVSTLNNSVAIEGIKKEKSKGDKIDVYIRASNVIITDLNSDDKWRINKLENKKPKSIKKEIKEKPEGIKNEEKLPRKKTEIKSNKTKSEGKINKDVKRKFIKKTTKESEK